MCVCERLAYRSMIQVFERYNFSLPARCVNTPFPSIFWFGHCDAEVGLEGSQETLEQVFQRLWDLEELKWMLPAMAAVSSKTSCMHKDGLKNTDICVHLAELLSFRPICANSGDLLHMYTMCSRITLHTCMYACMYVCVEKINFGRPSCFAKRGGEERTPALSRHAGYLGR